jgi:hypothetical protein
MRTHAHSPLTVCSRRSLAEKITPAVSYKIITCLLNALYPSSLFTSVYSILIVKNKDGI